MTCYVFEKKSGNRIRTAVLFQNFPRSTEEYRKNILWWPVSLPIIEDVNSWWL